ncbi:CPBP family intramembrane metalloprotease [Rhodocytophaga aerolata]|uniref:CPBP family intramembrane metalloprotease n=1 Tax=Rhodocytophaga aerolata TaxID=455078 RepID=A0ABT8QZZ7_9BACT|nr:CPBP family intramembrane glutamic endopeptidase [Rhodocytophaga aerolata]MDO1445415.1 CPBP family intramembrane metalloprotease [Rhodocytophaga aerolata]
MKKILSYLRDHIRTDFHLATYILVAIFLVTTIVINYWLDFEDSIIDSYYGQPVYFLWYFLFYSFAYFGTVLLMAVDPANRAFLKNKLFWVISLAGMGILALDGGFYFQQPIAESVPYVLQNYTLKILNNVYSLFTILLPLLIIYLTISDRSTGFYGITNLKTDWRPYVYMLLIMAPLIAAASFGPDFQEDYPSYPDTLAHKYIGVPKWITVLLFELVYGWDFVATEWIFRGFLVIGMASVMGHRAVLPMVVTYAFLHYGKPLGETIGSVFGGYILGVIALRTGSIWGGIAIHLGVAWLMEIAAFLQKIAK